MIVKILGKGCPKCKRVEQLMQEVISELNLDAEVVKVTDVNEIMAYDILSTPALVVNEEVVCYGRIPQKDEVIEWLQVIDMG